MTGAEGLYSIYLSLRGALARAVMGIVPPKEIEDIVQETYVRACQVERKAEIKTPRSFLLKTARNLALDHIKRAESRLSVSLDETLLPEAGGQDELADGTYDEVASNEEFALFCEAVRHLPQQCRRAFVLKKVYGYSRREIAEIMGLSEHTVQTQIARGTKRCMHFMERQDGSRSRGGERCATKTARSRAGSGGERET